MAITACWDATTCRIAPHSRNQRGFQAIGRRRQDQFCGAGQPALPRPQTKILELSGATSLWHLKRASLGATLSTAAAASVREIISASAHQFCASSVGTYSCPLDPCMITSRGTQKNETPTKSARPRQPGTRVAEINSNRRRTRPCAVATSSIQVPPQFRTNAPRRAPNLTTLRSSTHVISQIRRVSNERPSD